MMVLVGKTECRDWKTVTGVLGDSHSPVLITEIHSHGRDVEAQPQNRVANTARRRSGQRRNVMRGEELHAVFGLDVRLF